MSFASTRITFGRPALTAACAATGSAARIPPALEPHRAQFFTLNSMDDLLALRARRREVGKARWAIIGGGLIGCELASDLKRAGDRVAIFHGGARLLERQLSEEESHALHEHFARLGVELFYELDLREPFPRSRFDAMVVCTGFAPRVELARAAGLATAQGIVVNDYLRSVDPAIYAVGDVAEVGGRLYPFVAPVRSQALWLAQHLAGRSHAPWTPPAFSPAPKIHGFAVQRQAVAVRV
jgi:NAD(P)H-nitrite reductase large subunit